MALSWSYLELSCFGMMMIVFWYHAHTHTHAHTYQHTHTQTPAHVRMRARTLTHARVHTHTHTCTNTHTHARKFSCPHTYAHTPRSYIGTIFRHVMDVYVLVCLHVMCACSCSLVIIKQIINTNLLFPNRTRSTNSTLKPLDTSSDLAVAFLLGLLAILPSVNVVRAAQDAAWSCASVAVAAILKLAGY